MSLSHHMMQTWFSLDDLITVVQASTLGSRDAVSEVLLKTNMEAKDIAAGLQQFVHTVQSTVDLVVVANNFYMQHFSERPMMDTFHSSICASGGTALQLHRCTIGVSDLITSYNFFLQHFEAALLGLLQTVADLQTSLDHLESHFSVIQDLFSIKSHTLSIARDEVLNNILTLLRFHHKQLAQFRAQHGLLDMVEALEALQTLLAEPTLTGKSLPVEVLIDIINSGIERLRRRSNEIDVYWKKCHETLN
ncbi:hypothetical protein BD769DRAFT_1677726 [Suillus cothurnatus]|nr:hypothetical protein BD769DRAFT_1677726 [Suillus cothurnatus]